MRAPDVDCLIAGAGCAGLSLAVHLAHSPDWSGSILLLDPRDGYSRDRTWCFWDVEPHPFESAVTHSWDQWSLRYGDRTIVSESNLFRYQYLPADRFYTEALRILGESPDVEVRLGTPIDDLAPDPAGGVKAATPDGSIRANVAFDSRHSPQADASVFDETILLQHFAGAVIGLESGAFDPKQALLMDFDVDQGEAIHFVYVLPFDHRTALVEDTWLSPEPISERAYHENIRGYVRRRFGVNSFTVLHAERGVIPMAEPRPAPSADAGIVRIGVRGGLARPSSGYAFIAIQRHSRALVRWMAAGQGGPPPRPYRSRTVFLDRVFLSYIRRHPAKAPDLFARMFAGVDPDVFVRFLSDTETLPDALRMMSALPAAPLIREAIRTRGRAQTGL